MRRLRSTRILLAVAATALLLLVVAQVVLPRIAAHTISSRVGRYGSVASVDVSAFPALELLWGSADSVRVRARTLALSPAHAAALLWEGRGVERMDVRAEHVTIGPLRLSDATLSKRGRLLRARAQASAADVAAALPPGFGVRLVSSGGGRVEVQASGGLFGVGSSVPAVAQALGGRLIAHPLGALVEGFQLTLFSDRHVFVEGVGASVEGTPPRRYSLSMDASLR